MYINWAHHYIPKVGGACSFFINVLFIYIVQDDKKVQIGNYKILLLSFAIYNLASTAIDLIVPLCIFDYKRAFSYFVVTGLFEKKSALGAIAICIRCSFIPAAYGILHSHFIYRYMVLFNRQVLTKYFLPYGLIMSVAYCAVLMAIWFYAAYVFVLAQKESRLYLETIFREKFDQDINDLNIVIALYGDASIEIIRNSWTGILIGTFISLYSVVVYVVLGTQIVHKLQSTDLVMSDKTKYLQKQLMNALMVQATIPMIVCFTPCFLAWYLPVFNLDIGNWIYWTSTVAISFFPVLDPLSLFYFLPVFGARVREIIGIKRNTTRISSGLKIATLNS